MTITLNPELEALIRDKVASGRYDTADDLIADALRSLDERERLTRFRAAIDVGLADMERGAFVEWGPDTMDRLQREADEADRLGLPIDPDVCP